jgi:hypothetical protein
MFGSSNSVLPEAVECLTDGALEHMAGHRISEGCVSADLGGGSGCIPAAEDS